MELAAVRLLRAAKISGGSCKGGGKVKGASGEPAWLPPEVLLIEMLKLA